ASAKGLEELVEAIVAYFKRTQALDLKADNVIITNGVTEAVKIAMDVFINEGDKIIVPSPFFGLYEMTAAIAGAELVTLDTSQTDFKLTPKALERSLDANPETRLV
ncbi:aminotransferase class I/II-fold pyridoxal phosphate-dependent enzyme, partial [Streptococcus anginosus]